jgi:hypothetical protein
MSRASIKAINAYTSLCDLERSIARVPLGEHVDAVASNWALQEFRRCMAKTTKEELLRTRNQHVSIEQWNEMTRRASGGTSALFDELDWRTYKKRRGQRRVADAPGCTIWETRVGPAVSYDIGNGVATADKSTELWANLNLLAAQCVLFHIQQQSADVAEDDK